MAIILYWLTEWEQNGRRLNAWSSKFTLMMLTCSIFEILHEYSLHFSLKINDKWLDGMINGKSRMERGKTLSSCIWVKYLKVNIFLIIQSSFN